MEVVALSLPRLKGAISGPITVYRLTVTAAHFSANRGGEGRGGSGKRQKHAGLVGGGGGGTCCAACLGA